MSFVSKELKKLLVGATEVFEVEPVSQANVAGFTRLKLRGRPGLPVFISKELDIVVKLPGCILEPRTPLHLRIPTVRLKYGWVAQPRANRKNAKRAEAIIFRKLAPYRKRGIFPDLHTGNVGFWKNKAVLIDW